jgi:hypothetical protein
MGRRLAHFVNEHDIVPRVPPSYFHCGSLVWFTNGIVKRSSAGHILYAAPGSDQPASIADGILPPLSKDEFERAKAGVRDMRSQGTQSADNAKMLKAGWPAILENHFMNYYLDKIHGLFKKAGSN